MNEKDAKYLAAMEVNIAGHERHLALLKQERLDFYQGRGIVPPEFAEGIEALRLAAISKETMRVMRGGAVKAPTQEETIKELTATNEMSEKVFGTFFSNAVPAADRDGDIVDLRGVTLNGFPVHMSERVTSLFREPVEMTYVLDDMRNIRAVWQEEDGGVAAKNKEIAALEAKFAARYGALVKAPNASLSWLDEPTGAGTLAAPEEKKEPSPQSPEEPARKIRFREFL